MKAYLFPGQGSQYKGMGADLFDEFPDMTAQADAILGYSIAALCLWDESNQLNNTAYTQPALYVVNALSYLHNIKSHPTKPSFFAGHSLGEYNALFAARVLDFATGLKLVKKRGEIMSAANGGSMAAVLNCDEASLTRILHENNLLDIDVANFNSPNQIVISGMQTSMDAANQVFSRAGFTFIPLRVSAAFHSRYMTNAAEAFGQYLQQMSLHAPAGKVIANISAEYYTTENIVSNLQNQINHSVQWTETIRHLLALGVTEFIEIGPGNVLTKLVKAIQENTTASDLKKWRTSRETKTTIQAETLGSRIFRETYGIKYAYLTGAMVKGIASKELVLRLANAGLMGFYGTGGMRLADIENDIIYLQQHAAANSSYGMNLLCNLVNPAIEMATVDLFLKHNIRFVEAAAYIQLNTAIVKYRVKGPKGSKDGITIPHKLLAKVSRPEVATIFLNPPPKKILQQLLADGSITREEAALAERIPMADDLCVEADSGGHTDMGNMNVLLPAMMRLRDEVCAAKSYQEVVRIGAAGGIGTPEAAAAAFVLGADFIMTGSINQCTVEAGTSDTVKEMLSLMDVQDTDYAPAGDMFELGAKIQVLRKGVFFPARGNKLYDLWRHYAAWEEIDLKTREQIESRYFGRSFDDVYTETKAYYSAKLPQEIIKAEANPEHKMALVFRWYFIHSQRLAKEGNKDDIVNFQIHTSPAMGAFNQWIKNSKLYNWRERHVEAIAELLMTHTAELLNHRLNQMLFQ